MIRVVGVRFKAAGKVYYFDPADSPITTGDRVVVETARGVEYGEVAVGPKEVTEDEVVQPLKRVLRVGTDRDAVVAAENKRKERDAFGTAQKKIEAHGLEMNLVDVEYTFDGSKVIFYFTAEGRIDFRELVRDLASVFRTRIEMRQIGVRDEAKMLGGLGPCGRILCCTSFLGDFAPVSIRMAKDQNLSLNPTKISGLCGRLMCCLRYEQDTYEAAKKDPTLAPGYVPPVVPAEEPLPELTRLEDPPAQKVTARRAALGGISARIAQAAGLDEPLGQPEQRTGERRGGDRPSAGTNRPQGASNRKERPARPEGQSAAGQPQERRDGQGKGRRQGKPQNAGDKPQPRPQSGQQGGERALPGKVPGTDKPGQLRQLPGEKLRGARVAPEQEQQEAAPQEKQGGKSRRRSRRSRSRGQGAVPRAEETAVTKASPERAPRPERPQSERSQQPDRREPGGQQHDQSAQGGAQQGERPQGSRAHRRNRRGRRRSGGGGGGDRSGAGESGGNANGGSGGGQPT